MSYKVTNVRHEAKGMTINEYREMIQAEQRGERRAALLAWLRLVGLLVVGIAVIWLVTAYIQGGLDKDQKKMDDAVEFMKRGK